MLRPARALVALLAVLALAVSLQAPADAKPRQKDPDGSYEGNEVPAPEAPLDQVYISFDVKGDGRKIKDFVVTMNVVCTTYPLSVELISQPMNPMRVDTKKGTFRDLVVGATEDGTEYRVEVTGRLVGRKVTGGTLSYEVGVCQRGNDPGDPLRWGAARVGR